MTKFMYFGLRRGDDVALLVGPFENDEFILKYKESLQSAYHFYINHRPGDELVMVKYDEDKGEGIIHEKSMIYVKTGFRGHSWFENYKSGAPLCALHQMPCNILTDRYSSLMTSQENLSQNSRESL